MISTVVEARQVEVTSTRLGFRVGGLGIVRQYIIYVYIYIHIHMHMFLWAFPKLREFFAGPLEDYSILSSILAPPRRP